MTDGPASTNGPLAGVLVADFSRVLAGPFATTALADLGATVVKVERPGAGDETRAWGPPWTAGSSSYFECVNRGKYGVAWDLADEADAAAARELARRADVVVENFRPGSLARYGLDHDTVRATNPAVVYCSISGFGSGAGADRPGYDFVAQAVGGLMSITGDPGEPRKVGVALVDVLTGKDAIIGILAALRAREWTGRGEHVEVNLLSSLLGGLVNQAAGYLASGRRPAAMGNRHPSIAPYETLRCADGLLAVACGNDRQFGALAALLDRAGLVDDPRFATNPQRVRHRDELVAELEAVLRTAPAAEWERRFTDANVPAGLVGSVADGIARAQDLGLDPLVDLGPDHPPQLRHPVRYGCTRPAAPTPPPGLGEHNDAIGHWLAAPPAPLLPRT